MVSLTRWPRTDCWCSPVCISWAPGPAPLSRWGGRLKCDVDHDGLISGLDTAEGDTQLLNISKMSLQLLLHTTFKRIIFQLENGFSEKLPVTFGLFSPVGISVTKISVSGGWYPIIRRKLFKPGKFNESLYRDLFFTWMKWKVLESKQNNIFLIFNHWLWEVEVL